MIALLFNILFFLIPLIFLKNTSELFEFNKIIILYIFTILTVSAWAINSIAQKRLIFRRTILDIPITLYLFTLLLSTLFSIDPRTSVLGYYSRFNGGLISQICYALLYWAFVSNLNKKQSLSTMYYVLTSTAIVSVLAVLEHFGFFTTCGLMGFGYYESCWVQDVQNRVFSTLGQPNWLAALLVALIPLTWRKSYWHYLLSVLFFITLLFTKSRSGLLAFGIEAIIFWGFVFWQNKLKFAKEFLILLIISVSLFFVFQKPITNNLSPITYQGNSLETGGTESGTIRKYVWLGAINVFKNYPILGSGPETFAFTFPIYKPIEHNLTSEWDFIYNKAHNEYLNYLANIGILGFISYLSLIIYSIIIIWRSKRFDLLAGYFAILVTNFFGFSIVPVSLLFFLFPAIAVQSTEYLVPSKQTAKLNYVQIIVVLLTLCTMYYVLSTVYSYWRADIYYNSARNYNREKKPEQALVEINKALAFEPNEPLYIAEFALTNKDVDMAAKALDLNPYNQNVRNILISNLNDLLIAEQIAKVGTNIAPMNPKTFYQLGILNLKNNKINNGISNLEKAVNLKPNYKEARFALGLTYIDTKNYEKAKENLEYILNNIDSNDELTKKYLDQAKSASIMVY